MRRRLVGIAMVIGLGGLIVGAAAFAVATRESPPPATNTIARPPPDLTSSTTLPPQPPPPSTTTTTTVPVRKTGTVPGWTVGQPWGDTIGLTMFRGNPTRTFYGTGPLPETAPETLWTYPEDAMCGSSAVGGETTLWCGTGWTGQPVVWERPDGVTEVIFGAYDKAVHFVDAAAGTETRPPFPVGDIIKGSVTLDPDGFPLLYFGSRDNKLRVVALDREPVEELWSLDSSVVRGIWNNDWDGNPVVVDDVLFEGGENSWFFAIVLNRRFGSDGLVTVDPEIAYSTPGWTDELLAQVGQNVSIESSVAVWEDRVYFANSGGRVVGLDVTDVRSGIAPVAFDYWVGDDIDATVVVDADGMLYVAAELERRTPRSEEVGQLVKLDPFTDGDPLVWGIPVPGLEGGDGGMWATPALGDGFVYVPTHSGRLLAVDTDTGVIGWEDEVGPHAWSSAVIVDGDLLIGTCETGELRRYSLADPGNPALVWSVMAAGGCIESTPAVWNGRIYVGSRDGFFRAYGS